MEQRILNLLSRPHYTPRNAAELRAQLGLRRSQQSELEHALARMERNGQVARIKQGDRSLSLCLGRASWCSAFLQFSDSGPRLHAFTS